MEGTKLCDKQEAREIEVTPAMIEAAQNALVDSGYLSDPTVSEEETIRSILSAALSARAT